MSTSKQIFKFNQIQNGNSNPSISWSKDGNYLAVGTDNKLVYVINKRGKTISQKQIPVKGKILTVDWDYQNETIGIMVDGLSYIYLWSPFTTNALDELQFDNQKSKVTWMKWSKSHPVLTFGNEKGYLNFYMKKNKRKIPTMGKHSKKITSGDWNNEGLLVTGSQDKIITISNYNSDSASNSIATKIQPQNLRWIQVKNDTRSKKFNTICGVLNKKTFLIHQLNKDNNAPLELMFDNKYGKIVDYQFYGDGYIIIGFTEGYYCHVSTMQSEMKKQIKSQRVFHGSLESIAVDGAFNKIALAGQNKIKIYGLNDWKQIKQETFQLPNASGKVSEMKFAPDGTTLSITTTNGMLFGYVLTLNIMLSTYNDLVAILQSLTEVTIMNCASKKKGQIISNIVLNKQPNMISLGPNHLISKVGNYIHVYEWLRQKKIVTGGRQINELELDYNVINIELNQNYIGLLNDQHLLYLYSIDGNDKIKIFPIQNNLQILSFFITKDFLIMLNDNNKLKYYHIHDHNFIIQHQSNNPILKVFPNKFGTKLILIHKNSEVNLFITSTETYYHVKTPFERINKVLWDNQNQNQFIIISCNHVYSYVISKNNIYGKIVNIVNEILDMENVHQQIGQPYTTLIDKKIICLSNGITFFLNGISINTLQLSYHTFLNNYNPETQASEGHTRYFLLNIALRKFDMCLIAAKQMKSNTCYQVLGKKALENLELEIAIKSYQMGKNLAMLLTIQPFIHCYQRNLLIGHVAMILGNYDLAQDHYLKSSQPINALDMRCDIQDWFIASSLAKNIAPQQGSFISKRLAAQTESQGNNTQALKQFEKSVINEELKSIDKLTVNKHNKQCFAGIARTSIKLGDVQRGFNLARDLKDKQLLMDIAVVCENMKQFNQAAQLYDKAQAYEKAATLYLSQGMFKEAAPLMKKIKSPSVLVKYGKAKEAQGCYKEAQQAYQNAQSWQDVVRLNLNNFDNLQKPKEILKKFPSPTIAQKVAAYSEKRRLWKEAITFNVMANKKEQAMIIARAHGLIDVYSIASECFTAKDHTEIAREYENQGLWDKAAEQYEKANQPLQALKLFIKAGQIHVPKMLKLIEKNSSITHLVQQLQDYLMGELDGQPKDPMHTYHLYRSLKEYIKAAKIAVTIASQQQQSGNYKGAHEILFQSYQDIKKANVPVLLELEKKLNILHSYILAAKRIGKMDNNANAALLLNKVANHILQFPAHAASILTSIVVKSMKADLKGLAYKRAIQVFRPEYKDQIPQKLVDKIKRVAMKPSNQEIPIQTSPCPFCKEPVPDFNDDCPKCLNTIPFCIASGKHVVAEDLAFCKNCNFPCNHSAMKKILEYPDLQKTCPMCGVSVTIDDIEFVGLNGVSRIKKVRPNKEQNEKK